MENQLSASEALYGFIGWLTTRKASITLSETHNAVEAADLVKKFCSVNQLEDPRDNWPSRLIHPKSNHG